MLKLFKQYYPIRNLIFILGEGLLIFSATILSSMFLLSKGFLSVDDQVIFKGILITLTCQICVYYNDLYDFQIADSFHELSIRLCQALGVSSIILAGVYLMFPELIIGRGIYAVSIAFTMLLIILWRFGYTAILNRGIFNENIILMGSGRLAQDILNEISDKKDSGYTIRVRFVEGNELFESEIEKNNEIVCKKGFDSLCDIANKTNIKKIVVALQQRRGTFPGKELLKCRVDGIDIIEGTSFYEMLTGKLIVEEINPAWLIFSKGFKKSRKKRIVKRSGDLFLSTTLLMLLTPLILLVALLVKLDSKGPIIFSQERVGEKRRNYRILKFRSMVEDAEKLSGPVWASDDDNRITRVGAIIRKLRIDEIPQLWNVLKGEMSFVGPRPERDFFVKELEEEIPYYGERFTVKPGITGWAQVSYGYGASVDDAKEKLKYDLFYTKNFSFLMDVMIIMRTIKIVLFGKGAR
jgi:sugar transferase (PEP-CTERM system associated)